MEIQHNSTQRSYKASASPRVNPTLDLVLWGENREHSVCNAKNNKSIPIWTWLWGTERCIPTAKPQRGAAHANDPCQGCLQRRLPWGFGFLPLMSW